MPPVEPKKVKIKKEPGTEVPTVTRVETKKSSSKVSIGKKRDKDGNNRNPSLVKAQRRLPKCREPPIPKAHWDYLLEEMTWLATDFYQESIWKRAAAKHFALECQAAVRLKYNLDVDDQNWRKRRCAKIAEMVYYLWKSMSNDNYFQVRQFWKSLRVLHAYQKIVSDKKETHDGLITRPATPDTVSDNEAGNSRVAELLHVSRRSFLNNTGLRSVF